LRGVGVAGKRGRKIYDQKTKKRGTWGRGVSPVMGLERIRAPF